MRILPPNFGEYLFNFSIMYKSRFAYTFLFTLWMFNALAQWESCGTGLPQGAFAYDLVNVGSELLMATDSQVYRSGILGDNWIPSSTGLPPSDLRMNSLIVHQGRVFLGSDSAIYYSDDDGLSWSLSWITEARVVEFAEDSSALYAVSRGGGCLKSIDDGLSWQPSNSGFQTDTLTSILAVDNKLYIGSLYYGLYVSEDAGDTWISLTISQDPINVFEIISNGFEIFIGVRLWPHGNHYIMKSSDWGSSWTQINSSAFFQGFSILATTGICVGSAVLFAGEQVFLGSDYGSSWQSYSQGSSFPYNSFHATDEYLFLASGDFFSPELLYRRPLSQVLDVDEALSQRESFGLFPNPASEQVQILVSKNSHLSMQHITVTDQLGKAIFSQKFDGSAFVLPTGRISDGAYMVSVWMEDGSILNKRLMVQQP
ncbi:MAG: T9SS type A sorting domain-containing protein [Flavobacteriales bacterium]|nr:T9SS type A sorting domain-containing protein [Flavobacteriales bacterium]